MLRESTHRRRLGLILSGLVLPTLCGSLIQAQTAQPGATSKLPGSAQRSSLIASGDTSDLCLLYTGDVIGYLDPCG